MLDHMDGDADLEPYLGGWAGSTDDLEDINETAATCATSRTISAMKANISTSCSTVFCAFDASRIRRKLIRHLPQL
jgi:hypothetical protein